MTLGDRLLETARARGSHPAIEDGDNVLSYDGLAVEIETWSCRLHNAGLGAGSLVAVVMADSASHLIVLAALANSGAVIYSLSPSLPRAALERALAAQPVKALIADPDVPLLDGPPRLTPKKLARLRGAAVTPVAVGQDDPLLLIQSSGTTGAPKFHLRSHAQFDEWVRRYARSQAWSDADRCLCLTPMSFNVGRSIGLGMLRIGATVVVRRVTEPAEIAAKVHKAGITYLKLTPSHVQSLLAMEPSAQPLFPDLRAMVTGSAPLARTQREEARRRLSPNLCEQLGTNEGGLMAFAWPADQDAYPDSVGRIVEGVEAQVVDLDGRVLATGEVGEIRFRGPGFASGYLDDPTASAKAFRDGWFYPGDLAALNDEGYIFFKGRADDVINNEGAKFYPSEVEAVLLEHPAVDEAAVVGQADAVHGEVAVALVVTNAPLGLEELAAFFRRRLATYKHPQGLAFVEALPRNPMGKVDKARIRDMVAQSSIVEAR